MNGLTTNEALVAAIQQAREQQGLTWDEIHQRGGPSAATMTKLVKGEPVGISRATCRKLDAAFGWPTDTARRLALGHDPKEADPHGDAAAKTKPAGGTRNPAAGSVKHVDAQGRVVETDGPSRAHLLGLADELRRLADQLERDVDEDHDATT